MYIQDLHISQLVKGALSYVPPVYRFGRRLSATKGTDSPSYCYAVWLRHLSTLAQHGLPTCINSFAEFGPGDSLGIGLCAILTGVDKYHAFDVVEYSNVSRNLRILDGLIRLLERREPIPDDTVYPDMAPKLQDYSFPHYILDERRLRRCLDPHRIDSIRQALLGKSVSETPLPSIEYVVPWFDADLIEDDSIDLILSQAVLEHVDDLARTYQTMRMWLKPYGIVSHVIDFRSHGITRKWNGHWRIPERVWERLIRGRRYYLINRQPYSVHKHYLSSCNFEIIHTDSAHARCAIDRNELAPEFRALPDEDLTTSGVYLLARKLPTSGEQ